MALTLAQLTTLKANILADPVLSLKPNNDDGNFEIAAAYNLNAVPDFIVWRTSILTAEVKKNVVWTELIARSQAERESFRFMLEDGMLNAADANVRQGIQDIFSGPGGVTTRAQLVVLAKRKATRAEKLFATGTGSDATPATMTFEGNLTYLDIGQARALL